MEAPVHYTALDVYSRLSLGYDLSFGSSLAKVGRLREKKNYFCKLSDRQTYANLYVRQAIRCQGIVANYLFY